MLHKPHLTCWNLLLHSAGYFGAKTSKNSNRSTRATRDERSSEKRASGQSQPQVFESCFVAHHSKRTDLQEKEIEGEKRTLLWRDGIAAMPIPSKGMKTFARQKEHEATSTVLRKFCWIVCRRFALWHDVCQRWALEVVDTISIVISPELHEIS